MNFINSDIFLIADIFDVYNIETALPVIDLEAIETHLMAAKEEEQKVSLLKLSSFTFLRASIKSFHKLVTRCYGVEKHRTSST